MNARHSKVTDWGLSHVSITEAASILDVGCGGGRTLSKLAALATRGKVYGVDFSAASVTASRKYNASLIAQGRVQVLLGSVSELPFASNTFDLVTAVESHFWWPDLPNDLRETSRVLKPGGTLLLIAEIYRGGGSASARLAEKHISQVGFKLLTLDEHRLLLAQAGFSSIELDTVPSKSWLSASAGKG